MLGDSAVCSSAEAVVLTVGIFWRFLPST